MEAEDIARPPLAAETIDETVPLLGGERAETITVNASVKRRTFLIIVACIVLIDLGSWGAVAPAAQILEGIICRQYYEAGQDDPTKVVQLISNYDCKIAPVQNELAFLTGWFDTIFTIPTILLTIPYGALSDRTSRKFVVCLAMVGLILADGLVKVIAAFPHIFPLRLMFATPIFLLIGGGVGVATSLTYAIFADVFSPAERADAFFLLNGFGHLAATIAAPLSATLMLRNPWIPFLGSTPAYVCVLGLFCLLPNIKRAKVEPIVEDASMTKSMDVRERITEAARATSQFVRNNVVVIILIVPYTISTLPWAPFLVIYVSKKFNTSFSNATFLIAIRGIVSLIVLFFLIPLVNRLLTAKTSMSPLTRDLRITQASSVLLTIGVLGIGLAPSKPFFAAALIFVALGNAAFVGLRCVLAHLVPANNMGTLFTAMSVVQGAGTLIGGPFFAATFKVGMRTGLTGLPYLLVGGGLALFATAVFVTPLPKDQIPPPSEEDAETAET